LHQARCRDGERHQQRCPAHSPPRERASFLRITVVVMVMSVVMPAMAVIVASVVVVIVSVRLAQLAAPG
jgi:hypothetical protein